MITNIHDTYRMAKEFQERLQARAREALTQAIPFLEDPAHVDDVINFLMGGDLKFWLMETMENRPVDRLVHRVIFDIHYHIPNGRYLVEFSKDVESLENILKAHATKQIDPTGA